MKKLNLSASINLSESMKKLKLMDLGAMLSIIFIVLIIFIVYSVYSQIYLSMFGTNDVTAPSNIVRVDLKSYQETIDLINRLEAYEPNNPAPQNTNPFR